jgi:branched-chain amino acid transport system ATP-binding protein
MLELIDARAGYGSAQVLFDVSVAVQRGEVVTLLGRNGMGKTTTIAAIMGMIPLRGGELIIDGTRAGRLPDYRRARLGLGLVPERRRIFPTLTVRENLVATAAPAPDDRPSWTVERVFALFPQLQERATALGRHLSGGEQQMLAIGRALMTNPWLLLLDEATEGLAPVVCEAIWRALAELKSTGHAIFIVDKNLDVLRQLADRYYVLEKGRVCWSGDGAAFAAQTDVVEKYLGLG